MLERGGFHVHDVAAVTCADCCLFASENGWCLLVIMK